MMFCTIKSKPLALPWGRTPRLSSGLECLILGFPSISATLVVVGVGPLSGKGPRIIVFADASVLPRSVFVRGAHRSPLAVLIVVPLANWALYVLLSSALPDLDRTGQFSRGISLLGRHKPNYLLNKDTYPRFEYEDGEGRDRILNGFIRLLIPRKVNIVERARVENEVPIVTVAKHRTVTLLPTSVPRTSGELSASVEREFADMPRATVLDQGTNSAGPEVDSLASKDAVRSNEYFGEEKRKSCTEERNVLLEAKDREIEDLKSQLLKAKEESARYSTPFSGFLLSVGGGGELESVIAGKDQELSELGASSSSLRSENQSLLDQVHKLELSSADLRLKLETYEGVLAQLEEFQDNLMGPLKTRLAEIDTDFTRCCMRFQESFHPHLLNYMEALGHAFGRAIEKGMQEGLAAGIEHGKAGRCLADLEAYIPSAEDDFNSAIRDLRDLNFPLLQELSNKKDASTLEIMDLLRLDDIVAETLALSVALNVCRGRVEKMERNLIERLPFLKDVFASIEDPLSAEALIEPSAEVPATNVLSTVVIAPPPDPSISVEDYDNPDPAVEVPENAASGLEREEQTDASAGGGLTFSQLDEEAMDAVL
ncbi:hypothetical protein Tco_0680274 [Tanacetum coccineum]|uniref:Uncharacterized protein n=1 Tax=Tanacetum coccineum TaxID=301880 RepID=A0ABQ4XLJ6_9ASTR